MWLVVLGDRHRPDDFLVAAVYFTPWIGYQLLKVHDCGAGDYNVFNSSTYRAIRSCRRCVCRRWLVVVLTICALIASIASFASSQSSSSRHPTVPRSGGPCRPKAPPRVERRPNAS
jgi:hypothetical protein